jgi:hypothetical protein
VTIKEDKGEDLTEEQKAVYNAIFLDRWPTEKQKKDNDLGFMNSEKKRIETGPKKKAAPKTKAPKVVAPTKNVSSDRAVSAQKVAKFWSRFPECGERYTEAEKRKMLNTASNEELEGELIQCRALRSSGSSELIFNKIIYKGGEVLESVASTVPKLRPYTGNVMVKLAQQHALDDDIAELAIEYGYLLECGPIFRIIGTILHAASMQAIQNAITTRTVHEIESGNLKVAGKVDSSLQERYSSL